MKKNELIILLCCCGCFFCTGIVSNCFTIFLTPICDSLRFSMASLSAFVSLKGIATSFFTVVMTFLIKRYRIGHIASAGCLIAVFSYLALSGANALWQFYPLGLLLGCGQCAFSHFPVSLVIKNWFPKKNGSYIGLVMAFSGISGALMNPLISSLIDSYGWRHAYVTCALIIVLVGIPSAFFLKHSPDAYMEEEIEEKHSEKQDAPFLPLLLIGLMIGFNASGIAMATLLSSLVVSMDRPLSFGAYMISLSMIGNIGAKFLLGILADKKTPFYSVTLFSLFPILGVLIILLLHSSDLSLLIGSLLLGTVFSVGSAGSPLLINRLLTKNQFGIGFSVNSIAMQLGVSFFTILYGSLYDLRKDYLLSLFIAFVVLTLQLIVVRFMKRISIR